MVVANNGGNSYGFYNTPEWPNEIDIGHYLNDSKLIQLCKYWLTENVGNEYRDWSFMPRVNNNDHLYVGPLKVLGFKDREDAWNFLEWLEENDED